VFRRRHFGPEHPGFGLTPTGHCWCRKTSETRFLDRRKKPRNRDTRRLDDCGRPMPGGPSRLLFPKFLQEINAPIVLSFTGQTTKVAPIRRSFPFRFREQYPARPRRPKPSRGVPSAARGPLNCNVSRKQAIAPRSVEPLTQPFSLHDPPKKPTRKPLCYRFLMRTSPTSTELNTPSSGK
jgi:hypothetical protein